MPELMPGGEQLTVFFSDQRVNHGYDSAPLSFTYSDDWRSRPEAVTYPVWQWAVPWQSFIRRQDQYQIYSCLRTYYMG